ncbi:hypothetical protein ACWDRB_18770 [Nonomuraea sp. NPDC003707]
MRIASKSSSGPAASRIVTQVGGAEIAAALRIYGAGSDLGARGLAELEPEAAHTVADEQRTAGVRR